MTWLSRGLAWFPALTLLMAGISVLSLWMIPLPLGTLALVFSLYGWPVLVYRLHQWCFPIPEGISYLQGTTYSPWWGTHQIQAIYIAIPVLEAILRLIPGLFSVWLRLWGARVGRQVYWTPGLEIADRGLLEIGDRVIFGHRVGLYAHIIKPRKQNLMLYVNRIQIGHDVFIGAGSHLGPGVIVDSGTYLPVASNLYPNEAVSPEEVQ